MTPRRATRSRGSWSLRILVLAVTAAGVLAILHATGTYRLPLPGTEGAEGAPRTAHPSRVEGLVPVPAAAVELQAYAMVSGVDLFDRRRRRWVEMPLPAERVEEAGVMRTRAEIIGRVLRRNKSAGRVFTEDDFFPPGTRPGLTAGVPPGKRAVRVAAHRIAGVHGLHRGDMVDLVYASALKDDASDPPVISGPRGAELEMRTRQARLQARVRVRVVAREAVVVEPVRGRTAEVTSSSVLRGTRKSAKTVEELVLAMSPEEAVQLMAAFEMGAQVSCLPRSGRPGAAEESVTPDLEPPDPAKDGPGPVRFVEVIDGDKRRVVAVPEAD